MIGEFQLRIPAADEANPVVRHALRISLMATYKNLYEYLEAVERLAGPTHVSYLELRSSKSDGSNADESEPRLDASLTVCVYSHQTMADQGGASP